MLVITYKEERTSQTKPVLLLLKHCCCCQMMQSVKKLEFLFVQCTHSKNEMIFVSLGSITSIVLSTVLQDFFLVICRGILWVQLASNQKRNTNYKNEQNFNCNLSQRIPRRITRKKSCNTVDKTIDVMLPNDTNIISFFKWVH